MSIKPNEVETRPDSQLPDAEDLDVRSEEKRFEDHEEKVVSLWKGRFTRAENFRRPFIERNLRMYKLYRAYREAVNYAYGTSLMPPIGFEIIETVKPRLAAAEVAIDVFPTKAEDLNSPNLQKWDDLVEYNLQEAEFSDKKIYWIDSMLKYGNGVLQVMWDGTTADCEVVDNFLFYPDPQSMNRLKNSRWEIKQSYKSKAVLEKEEKERGDNPLYILDIKDEDGNPTSLINSKKWEEIAEEQPDADDPRKQRYEINTKKMGQVDDGTKKGQTVNEGESSTPDKDVGERLIEIWECFDHVEGKLQVVFNRKHLVRDEDNPYANVNDGQVFIDLPNISLPWEYHAMSILEPVETTIHEIADSRNQAMDDIIFSLDPIRKVKKGMGYKQDDLKHSPGAIWYLQKADDVIIERPPETSRSWVEKDNLLRREVQTSLALSEYTQGLPRSGQEPASKVEILLMQTNIRFSLMVRQLEIGMTELVNAIIDMNQEYLEEDVSMRILGQNFRFSEFKAEDKETVVDARVRIKPKREKTSEQETEEVTTLYETFVVGDKPEGQDEEAIEEWKVKKIALQRLMLEKMGYEHYKNVLAPKPKPKKEEPKPRPARREPGVEGTSRRRPPRIPRGGPGGMVNAPMPMPPGLQAGRPQPEQMLPLEETALPGASNQMTAPPGDGGMTGMLARLLGRRNQR